jgi:adenylylsulfate kinase-like enzyme
LAGFSGVDDPDEEPTDADLVLDTAHISPTAEAHPLGMR